MYKFDPCYRTRKPVRPISLWTFLAIPIVLLVAAICMILYDIFM